ncbi:MAG TPA: DUF4388 domain-containing protein [Thermoanaerobaculia bacterium]|nr:DUF4388 domain-containing protein [Thermoanaerobaculia bacterium]
MEFSGRLTAFPISDLLQWAKNERCTGALVIRRSEREKRIYFHAGDVVGCLSNDPAEFYGQHLLLQGFLNDDQLFRALSHCTQHKARLGVALQELGLLAPDAIQQTLRAQIEDVICDLFLWSRGIFYFQSEMPQEEEILPEPINVLGLILEGTRWADEVGRIRRVLVHDDVVLRRGERWPGDGSLNEVEKRLVGAVDGQRTLGELHKRIRGSYFRFLQGAFRLCVGSVLDIEEVLEAAGTGTHEMSVYDLLLEQATEEQALVARRHMALPLDLLERCFPVWVAEPTPEEQKRMPARARDFYARFDGRTSLGEAFSGDARLRGREMDLLLLQLQKGRLAILPASIERLEEEAEGRGLPALQRWWRRVFKPAAE